MHIDARQIDNQSVIEGDICIIGAGAAGISIALEWMNTPYKVILLEGGGFDYDDKVQELYNGKLTGQPYFPMKASRLHYFGGSTGHWGGMCSTFDELDFEKREWVENSGWPIKLKDIEPFYPRAHPILDLGPYEWDVKYWLKKNPSLKELPLDQNVIWSKMWQFSPPTRFGSKYKETIVGAKNIHLYTYANVVDITATENVSEIKEVVIKNYADRQHTVRAKFFIMACCSIQNSRVLLASNKQAPKGLGNDNDVVGRYFMEHPHIESGELWLANSDTLDLYQMGKGITERVEMAITAKKQEELKIMNGTISLTPLELSKNRISNIKMWSADDPRNSLDSFKKYNSLDRRNFFERHFMPSKLYKAYGLLTRMEQVPNPASRVELSTEKDALGVPRANLNWQMSPPDKITVTKIIEVFAQQIGISGVGRVRIPDFMLDTKDESVPSSLVSGGWHHLGTTRMSEDPKKGVVDANCKVHGISNLFVAGSSCFATGGAVNPTLTVVAISLRLSDYIKDQVKSSAKQA
ncbi:GMC oxidoreductase [Ferruginibacter sp. SUN106]|uniref:GMC oxidoreductase n=1 Tax=Ferruginibacter sp. SUN106 TaxID=2978348 RepID=UPI003D36844E